MLALYFIIFLFIIYLYYIFSNNRGNILNNKIENNGNIDTKCTKFKNLLKNKNSRLEQIISTKNS